MAIALSIFGVAFAAFCVWLTVRIVNRKERWAKWTLVAAIVLAYPLSFGPAIVAFNHGWIPKSGWVAYDRFYSPLKFFVNECRPVSWPYIWYLKMWIEPQPELNR